MNNKLTARIIAAAASIMLMATACEADGNDNGDDAVAGFYEDNTVRIIVGLSPGGGYDTYARAIARRLPEHIPGQPDIIVENMEGAGGLIAANNVYNALPSDGTVIGHWPMEMAVAQFLGLEEAEFESDEFHYLGAPTPDTRVCLAAAERVDEAGGETELLTRDDLEPLIIGSEAPGTNTYDIPAMMRDLFGANVDLAPGYPGTSEIRLAAQQGEVDGACLGWESAIATWTAELESGDFVPVIQSGEQPHEDMPDAMLYYDLASTPEEEEIVEVGIEVPARIARGFVVAPDVPQEHVDALRDAFAATFEDEEFLDDAEQANLVVRPVGGEEIQEIVNDLRDMSDVVQEALTPILLP